MPAECKALGQLLRGEKNVEEMEVNKGIEFCPHFQKKWPMSD